MKAFPGQWMDTRRARALAGALLLALALLAAMVVSRIFFHTGVQPQTIRLGAYEGDVGALEWIARDMGFYDELGLTVQITGYPSGKEAADALKTGQIDVATASDYVVASRSFAEADLRILGSIAHYRNKGVIGRRDRGIHTPADLKGKRIGVTIPSGAEYTLTVFLALHGLTVEDIHPVHLLPAQIEEAIAVGTIDATITWQPHVQSIEKKLGNNAVSFQGEGLDTYLLLVTRESRLMETGKALERMMQALLHAEDWAQARPQEARNYVARRFALDVAYVETQWKRMQLAVTLPQELLIAMDSQARWLAGRGNRPDTIPNFAGFIWAQPLRAADASAVTLYSEGKPPTASGAGHAH